MDASNMLKPALARNELRCVGATTLDEYRQHIKKMVLWNTVFSQFWSSTRSRGHRLHPEGLKDKYEVHHGIRIKDAALVAAVRLSHRYIADVNYRTKPST